MAHGVMFASLNRAQRSVHPLRQLALTAALAAFPLSGLSASAGADSTTAEALPVITPEPVLALPEVAPAPEAALPAARTIAGGSASYYAAKFEGRSTANGERYRASAMTAAHRSLPFGSKVRVTNPANGRSVTVRINDRGPFMPGRVIDVSRAAAEELGLIARGHAPVELVVIEG